MYSNYKLKYKSVQKAHKGQALTIGLDSIYTYVTFKRCMKQIIEIMHIIIIICEIKDDYEARFAKVTSLFREEDI